MPCPTCESKHPHLHPAVQVGGEVQLCADAFHLRVTPQNTPELIAEVVRDMPLYHPSRSQS